MEWLVEVLSKANVVGTWAAFVGSVIAIILAAVGEFIAVKRKFQEELNRKVIEKTLSPCTIEKVTIQLEKKNIAGGSVGEDYGPWKKQCRGSGEGQEA